MAPAFVQTHKDRGGTAVPPSTQYPIYPRQFGS